MPTNISCGYW